MERTINENLRELLLDIVLRLPNGYLPRELLVDILLRLPVKGLCQLKCVCKQWCFLIESPSFVKQHFEQERNRERLLVRLWEQNPELLDENEDPDQNDQEIVVQELDPEVDPDYALYIQQMIREQQEYQRELALENDGEYKCVLYVDETLSEYERPYHLQMPDEVGCLIGPLNGVFCVVTGYTLGPMALLNPALRQFKPLPLVQRVYPQNQDFVNSVLGIGLDPLTGDYKLVMLLYFLDIRNEEGQEHCVVYVCTSESDSWRLLEDVDPVISGSRVCSSLGVTYLNGVYYWLLESNDYSNVAILAFDMMTEKFRKIPVTGPIGRPRAEYLALCGDSLALLMYDQYERCIDVWMMVNEGCWIRRSRVGPLDNFKGLLCLWKNEELLFETTNGFLSLCNISTRESKIVEAPKVDKDAFLNWVFVYKESMVSIKGESGKCKLWDTSSDFIKNFFDDSLSEKYI